MTGGREWKQEPAPPKSQTSCWTVFRHPGRKLLRSPKQCLGSPPVGGVPALGSHARRAGKGSDGRIMPRIRASVTPTKPVPKRTLYSLYLSQVPPAHRIFGHRGSQPTRWLRCPLVFISGGAAEGTGGGSGRTFAKGKQWATGRAASISRTGF